MFGWHVICPFFKVKHGMNLRYLLAVALAATAPAASAHRVFVGSVVNIATIADDDIARHRSDPNYLDGIETHEMTFSENGFDWHILRFANKSKYDGPLWLVPHDDENAAFEAMIAAVKKYGGVGLAVNSGPGSLRHQSGNGLCGVKAATTKSCDPNRNFGQATPLFTANILNMRLPNQPVIALHTNGAGTAGDFSLLDIGAYARGRIMLRSGAYRAKNPTPQMDNYDTLGLIAYPVKNGKPSEAAVACRNALNEAGIHFWHERVGKSDGSLSNYLALERPDIPYFNAESREETDSSTSAARHGIMIDAYLGKCPQSGNQPVPRP
jgi:hypothetical protein